jgi:hypothetical protein
MGLATMGLGRWKRASGFHGGLRDQNRFIVIAERRNEEQKSDQRYGQDDEPPCARGELQGGKPKPGVGG